MRGDFYWTHRRQVHMDFHMPEFPAEAIRNFDALSFVNSLEHGKVNLVALFAKCHFGNSFYNTRVGHKHSGLPQDFLMETAAECRKRGIRTLAYYSLCWDKRAWDGNPDWRFVNEAGETVGAQSAFGFLCMNTPYRDELVIPQFEEVARDYPVDGFFLDIPYPMGAAPCYCKFCRARYATEYGHDMPRPFPAEEANLWVQRTTAGWLRELRAAVDRFDPRLAFVTNQVGNPRSCRNVLELSDIGVWESQPHPGDWLTHSLSSRTVRTLDRPVQVMTVRFYQGWGDLTLKPEPQLTTELAVMIGNGMAACVGDQVQVDGTLQKPVYETLRASFGFVEEREETLRGAASVKHVALLWPLKSRWHSPDFCLRADEQAGLRGAHKMLVESHVQFDVLHSIDLEQFPDYDVIVLPEPGGWYAEEVWTALRKWVSKGGTLVAAGSAVLAGGEFRMPDVFGVEYVEPSPFSVVAFVPDKRVRGACAELPLQLRGKSFKVIPRGAETLAQMHFPQAEYQPPVKAFRSPYSPPRLEASPFPFATTHAFGKGRAVYLAGSFFAAYWRTNHHWLRKFMVALYGHLVPEPPFTVDAPETVEANLMKRGRDLLLNLMRYPLGHQGGTGAIAAVESCYPLTGVTCRVKAPAGSVVTLAPGGGRLAASRQGKYVAFALPSLEIMATARLSRGGRDRG